MKSLKFSEPLPRMILAGEKDVTYRINDEKNISVGDKISLLDHDTRKEFAKVRVIGVEEKTFGELAEEDKKDMRNSSRTKRGTKRSRAITK